jgi:hypothetical protein
VSHSPPDLYTLQVTGKMRKCFGKTPILSTGWLASTHWVHYWIPRTEFYFLSCLPSLWTYIVNRKPEWKRALSSNNWNIMFLWGILWILSKISD